jgi:hypothetical protein
MENYEEELANLTRHKIVEFQNFQQEYEVKYPPPRLYLSGIGWQFWLSLVVSFAGIALAAFRTAQAFYQAAAFGGSKIFASSEAIVSVLAVEGSLVVFSVLRAYNKKVVSDSSTTFGRWTAFLISAIAGLGQSLNLMTNITTDVRGFFDWILVLVLGLGATIIAVLGGDLLGVSMVSYEQARKEATEHYDLSVRSYRAQMFARWKKRLAEPTAEQYPVRSATENRQNERRERTPRSGRSFLGSGEQKKRIVAELNGVCERENRVAGVTELAEQLGITKSYVSTVRRDWMQQNETQQNEIQENLSSGSPEQINPNEQQTNPNSQ